MPDPDLAAAAERLRRLQDSDLFRMDEDGERRYRIIGMAGGDLRIAGEDRGMTARERSRESFAVLAKAQEKSASRERIKVLEDGLLVESVKFDVVACDDCGPDDVECLTIEISKSGITLNRIGEDWRRAISWQNLCCFLEGSDAMEVFRKDLDEMRISLLHTASHAKELEKRIPSLESAACYKATLPIGESP